MKSSIWKNLEKELNLKENFNVIDFIEKNAEKYPDKTAFFLEDEKNKSKKISYKELLNQTNKFSNLLAKSGIKKHDRVALFLPKTPEIYIGTLAAIKTGAIAMPLFEAFQADGLELRLKRGEVNFLITNKELYKRLKNKKQFKNLKIIITDSFFFKRKLKKQSENFESVKMKKKDTALMIFTSSTAGTPVAGIQIPHHALIQWIYTAKNVLNLKENDNYWCTAHPAWVTGAVYGIMAPLLIGCSIFIKQGRFDSLKWKNFLAKYKISVLYTAPTVLRLWRNDIQQSDLKLLKSIFSVGEALPLSIVEHYKKSGIFIIDTYWQTETGAIVIANIKKKKGSLGQAIGVNIKINKDSMMIIEKPWPSMMTSIWKHKKMYKSYFEGKWFKTNDLARKDRQGNFYFEGRKDDMIKTSGERVSPLEIESVLLKHKAVKESAVIGVPDKERGSIIKAFIVLNKDYEARANEFLKDDISMFVKKSYAGHSYPKIVEFVKELPKGNSGKIIRSRLR